MKEKELRSLLKDMSLEEKVGQMVQLRADTLGGSDAMITGPTGGAEIRTEELKYVGSVLGASGAETLKEVCGKAQERQPHHIPLLCMLDVINGYQTIFPIPLAQGCSFDPELAKKGCEIAAREAAAAGLDVTFSPMLDLVRDARWGRVMESPGEDPYLNSCFAKAMVEGYQGDLGKDKLAACLKHFAGYGYPEGGREYDNAELSDGTLREDYLPAYAAAVKAGCRMAMTSFNTLNRVPSSANVYLMRQILRKEMGFDGVLISDYSAVEELVIHGIAEDKREAAKLALLAGVDIDMVSDVYLHYLPQLVRDKEVEESLIDEAVWRILKLKNDLGLFEHPLKDGSAEREEEVTLCEEHRKAAREAAAKTFVLLKNEDKILPLQADQADKLLLAGPYTDNREICGAWSFPKNYDAVGTIRERVAEKTKEKMPVYAKGCSLYEAGVPVKGMDLGGMTKKELEAALDEAEEKAKEAEKVILFLGEYFRQSGEASSQTSIRLPECQLELVRRVSAVNPNVATVIFSGRPVETLEIEERSKAVLLVWFPGTEGAGAIADVLFGDREPEGRLSMSIPYCTGQEPIYYNRFNGGRPYPKGAPNPYTIGYIDADYRPLHAFGYGFGYTEFSVSPVTLSTKAMTAKDTITASVQVKNIGKRKGSFIAQMYLRDITGSVVRPVRTLKGFRKIVLEPEETRTVSFEVTEEMLRFWRADHTFGSETGKFEIFIGESSETDNKAGFVLV